MAQFLLLFLILADAFPVQASGSSTVHPMAESAIRKLGNHQAKTAIYSSVSPSLSPSKAPKQAEAVHSGKEVSASDEETQFVHETTSHHRRHRPNDKSVAGGGVILGGLATTFLVAVFCYIRATRRRSVADEANADNAIPN
ncbi:uncharacterized protein LOC127789500 [Diospyros lotus]|uniref:uncharacterized protein LOC127789500 n=1 Tax=Diospyros lotus TaxID=55363 RepID=UPI00224DF047|nr:uncharacterized protein LOC127789500 [Diospyros lotus]